MRILEGLAEAIREKGLANAQLADIVRHARASRRTFYKHFDDKDSCFVELTRTIGELGLATVSAAIDREADWETQVEQSIDAYIELLLSDPPLTLTLASPSLGESVIRAQRDAIECYAVLARDVIAGQRFREAGLEPLSLQRIYMLISGLHMTAVRAVERGDEIRDLAPDLKATFKATLRGSVAE